MKRPTRKLVVRGEVIRALRTLENEGFACVVGGQDFAADVSGKECPANDMLVATVTAACR